MNKSFFGSLALQGTIPTWPAMALVGFLSVFIASGCLGPKVINYPEPAATVDVTPFREAGCDLNQPCKNGLEKTLGVDRLWPTNRLMGGLRPSYPMALGLVRDQEVFDPKAPPVPALHRVGCMMRQAVQLVIYREGRFEVIKDLAELKSTFAPIESPDEAVAYALVATGLQAFYGQKTSRDNDYKVKELVDTHVDQTPGGYRVHLFQHQVCGCGPKSTVAVVVEVSPAGDIKTLPPTVIYTDHDDRCVD